jgi:hypothetical protein
VNKFELHQRLTANEIDSRFFSLDARPQDESLVLEQKSPDTWIVYYCERGLRTGESHFGSESAACEYMLNTLLKDPTVKKQKS